MSGENKLSWTVKDLIPNGEYFFRVKAVNKIGGGEYIELKNPIIAQDPKRKLEYSHMMGRIEYARIIMFALIGFTNSNRYFSLFTRTT